MNDFKKWLDLAQQYQADNFWSQVFNDHEVPSASKTAANPFSIVNEYLPKCDLYSVDEKIVVEIEVPGVKKEDVNISISPQLVIVNGEFRSLKPHRKYFLKERANLKFQKEITLPLPVHANKSSIELIDGVLVISLPLSQVEAEEIPISFDEQT